MALLQYAPVVFNNGQPFHAGYGDIYYNPADGLAETEHVFIAGNYLRPRFAATTGDFVIAEVGFGSGLNFLHTVDVFLTTAPASARLHFISFENNPLTRDTLTRLCQSRPHPEISAVLLRQYPDNHAGHHLLKISPRIQLHLLWGDIRTMLPELRARVDAWFLDGFAPAKNPACWEKSLFLEMARHSHQQTTVATFSAARVVREGLLQAGFVVQKRPGFGRKREMITATLAHCPPPVAHWRDQSTAPAGAVALIGNGVAAATTARALADSGREVVIFYDPAAPAASLVPVAVPYLQPDRRDSAILHYQLNTWHHALRALALQNPIGMTCVPNNGQERRRYKELLAAKLLNDDYYFGDDAGALHYPRVGALALPKVLARLTNHPNITLTARKIKTLDELTAFAAKILCTGWQSSLNPEPLLRWAIRPVRGQGTIVRSRARLSGILCTQRTLIPLANGQIYSGGSFAANCADLTPREADEEDNLAAVHAVEGDEAEAEPLANFVGIRGATRDYLPLVGAIPLAESISEAYGQYRYNARADIAAAIDFHAGLYQHQGLGSKGCTLAWLNADLLTALINATPLPLPAPQIDLIAPARFFIRALKRNQLN